MIINLIYIAQLIDMSGRVLMEQMVNENSSRFAVNTKPGLYIYKFVGNNGVVSEKIDALGDYIAINYIQDGISVQDRTGALRHKSTTIDNTHRIIFRDSNEYQPEENYEDKDTVINIYGLPVENGTSNIFMSINYSLKEDFIDGFVRGASQATITEDGNVFAEEELVDGEVDILLQEAYDREIGITTHWCPH